MTEQQFCRALENARRRGPRPMLDAELASQLLRSAAAAQRRRESAEAVWERLASRDQRQRAAVESVEGGVLTITTADWATCRELRVSRIGRDLVRSVPGVTGVKYVVSGAQDDQPTEQHE